MHEDRRVWNLSPDSRPSAPLQITLPPLFPLHLKAVRACGVLPYLLEPGADQDGEGLGIGQANLLIDSKQRLQFIGRPGTSVALWTQRHLAYPYDFLTSGIQPGVGETSR